MSFKNERGADDAVVFTGDGVDDLDSLINRLNGMTATNGASRVKVLCDTGRTFSNYVLVTIDDVVALRQTYIEFWGTVNKPDYNRRPAPGVATPVDTTALPGEVTPNPEGIGNVGDWQDYGDGRANRKPPHTPAPI